MRKRRIHVATGPSKKLPRPLSPVSYATPDDVDELIGFLAALSADLSKEDIDEDRVADLARDLAHRKGGVALIVRGDAGIEASMGLVVDRSFFSRGHRLRSAWLVVIHEARTTTSHARSLLLAARKFADALSRPLLLEEFTDDIDFTAGKVKMISRHMHSTGAVFLYVPGTAAA